MYIHASQAMFRPDPWFLSAPGRFCVVAEGRQCAGGTLPSKATWGDQVTVKKKGVDLDGRVCPAADFWFQGLSSRRAILHRKGKEPSARRRGVGGGGQFQRGSAGHRQWRYSSRATAPETLLLVSYRWGLAW